ncbi:MAG: DUF5685 family protein [Myxococcota bacterium]
MFGLMKPDEARLSHSQRVRHGRYYCGLCHGVGTHVGHGWRGLHSHDAIFIATVVDGLVESAAAPSSCRCPMLPVVHKKSTDPGSVAIRFAVGVQLLLADQWVADKAEEGSKAAKFARHMLQAPVNRGATLLKELGVDTKELRAVPAEQGAAERDFDTARQSASDAAAPTERALAAVFGAIATLPGADAQMTTPLTRLGHNLGRAIYLIDALEDLEEDAQEDAFNPCLLDRSPDAKRVDTACVDLEVAVQQVEDAVAELAWHNNQDLVSASIGEVRRRANTAIESARAMVTEDRKASLATWLNQPAWVHAAAALLTAFTSFWAAISTTAQAGTEQAGITVRAALPAWIAPRAQQCPCDGCAKACDSCGKCGEGCSKGCDDCGNSCGECTKGCTDCLDGCTKCMDGCNNCSNGCNSLGSLFGWAV